MLRKLREARDEEGFTLIELLVVVLIIGILAAIAIPVFLNQREKAYRDAVQADLRNSAIVMEDYFSDNNTYPAAGPVPGFNTSEGVTLAIDSVSVNTYCLEASHSGLDSNGDGVPDPYNYAVVTGSVTAEVAAGACP